MGQAEAVERQTGKVETLKAEYARGQVEKEVLERQSSLLQKMTVSASRKKYPLENIPYLQS